MALNTNSLKIFNLVLNLLMFFGTAAAALITLFEMKVHFNLGNKISYLMVTFSLVMRISLTCQEFHSGVYTRETWKYYYKWFMNFGFMVPQTKNRVCVYKLCGLLLQLFFQSDGELESELRAEATERCDQITRHLAAV